MNSRLVIVHGENILERTKKALEKLAPNLPPEGAKILIKPNLMEPRLKNSGAITRPIVIEAIIQFLSGQKYQIFVGEGTAVPTTLIAFRLGGYFSLTKKYNIKLVDLNKGPFLKIKTNQDFWPEIEIAKLAKEVDYLISVCPLKEHSYGVTLSLKNMMGILRPYGLPNKSYIHKENNKELWAKRLCLLLKYIKPNLAIIDGTTGMYGSHVNGRLIYHNLTIAGEDPLAVDFCGAEILGHQENFYLKMALEEGIGKKTEITQLY